VHLKNDVHFFLTIIGLFCRIQSFLQGSFANETYDFKKPTIFLRYTYMTPHYRCCCYCKLQICDVRAPHIYGYTTKYIHLCIHIYSYIYVYIHIHIYIHIYMNMFIHIHIYGISIYIHGYTTKHMKTRGVYVNIWICTHVHYTPLICIPNTMYEGTCCLRQI